MKNKVIRNILIIICILIILFSLIQIVRIVQEYRAGRASYDDLKDQVSVTENTAENGSDSAGLPEDTSAAGPQSDVILWPTVNFEKLQQINPEIIAWLYSEGTVISYPVAHTDNNDYYLTHMFNGTVNKSGCLFLDAWNYPDFSDENSIIHGHHMKNDTMFGSLMGYKKQEYYEEHPRMLLLTPDGNYVIEIFAGFVADADEDAWAMWFDSDEEKEDWIMERCRRSYFDSGIVPDVNDRIVTLSTCSYEFDTARFVLYGVLQAE